MLIAMLTKRQAVHEVCTGDGRNFASFANFFEVFAKFFEVFASFSKFSDVLGAAWTCSDTFGCIRMRLGAFGCVRTLSEKNRIFKKSVSIFLFFCILCQVFRLNILVFSFILLAR